MKEALSELLQEMPILRSQSVGTSSHPASAVPGPSTKPEGVKAGGKSNKCDSVNPERGIIVEPLVCHGMFEARSSQASWLVVPQVVQGPGARGLGLYPWETTQKGGWVSP